MCDYLTASLSVFPALNEGTFIAGIEIRWVGLRGFTPVRAARWETRNVPKPVIVMELPFLSSFVTSVVSASREAAAARLVIPAASAMALMMSCLDMGLRGKKYVKLSVRGKSACASQKIVTFSQIEIVVQENRLCKPKKMNTKDARVIRWRGRSIGE